MHGQIRFLITAVAMILGGLLAASGFIIAKKPNAKDLLDKISPFQGSIGVLMLGVGVWDLLWILTHLDIIKFLLKVPVMKWKLFIITVLVASPVNILVGILLGATLIFKYVKSDAAQEKMDVVRQKLVKFQVPLGFIASINGLLLLVFYFML